ncbi:MAG: DivIVA domain-containing protein [Planctomycetaceae bacterium]
MAGKQEAPRAPSGRGITPLEIQQKEFRVSRFGGYRMRDVDEFLDEVTSSLQATLAENERLRAQASAAPVVGAPDLDDVARQADEIIERARDEAARIVADAKERAASAAGTSAAELTTDQERAAVNAFLAKEREFLQSLAALVQGHAESVKSMARASRGASASSAGSGTAQPAPKPTAQPAPKPTAPPARPSAARPAPEPSAPVTDPDATQAIERPAPEPRAPVTDLDATQAIERPAPEPTERPEEGGEQDRTIRVEEPQPATAKNEGEGDTSLRELFWGEEG